MNNKIFNVAFRADASLKMGFGHIFRCLTLAKALRARGAECLFICREHEGNLLDFIRQNHFDAISLLLTDNPSPDSRSGLPEPAHHEWLGASWQLDAKQTLDAMNGLKPDWFILDHYALDARWETTVRSHCGKMMVIDDLADRDHDCDILLDQNLVANLTDRYAQWVSNRTTCLLGPHYAMLQREYAEWYEQTPPRTGRIRRLLVYFGGADISNQTGRTLSAFLELKRTEIAIDVVINPQSPHAPEIKKQAARHSNIIVHETLPSLAPLMIKADLAIGAGGSTSWERCCLGLPSLVITLAENQKPLAEALDRKGLIRWLGHHDQVDLSTIKDALQTALIHESVESWSQQCRKLVDGKGVERVVEIMLLNPDTPLTAQSATLDDETVMGSLLTETIKSREQAHLKEHDPRDIRDWFYKHLRHPETSRIYTLTTGQGLPIGMVRFEFHDDQWDMFYLLNHYAQNSHLLEAVMNHALRAFRHSYNGALSFGSVKPEPGPDSSKTSDSPFPKSRKNSSPLTITICSDAKSWINASIPAAIFSWISQGHRCIWTHDANKLSEGDLCFFLSYGRIVPPAILKRHQHNLVIHASKLPEGKGWSPLTWQILEGKNRIPVTLFEAAKQVDSGCIYAQDWMEFKGHELIDEMRQKLADVTLTMCRRFVDQFPASAERGSIQKGKESFYGRRGPEDSEINPNQNLLEQFDLLRTVDNDSYPAYFRHRNKTYKIHISLMNVEKNENEKTK